MTAMERIFGGAPGAVLVRLAVLSVVVGVVLSTIGIHPYELVESIQRLAFRVYNMGFDAVEWLLAYLWLGALIVVPVWLASRLWNLYAYGGRRDPFEDAADAPAGKPRAR